MREQRDLNVLKRAQIRKDAGDLKGARHASARDAVGGRAGDISAFESDAPRVGTQQPGQGIEESALTGAIWADDGPEFATLDSQVDAAERHKTAEAFD